MVTWIGESAATCLVFEVLEEFLEAFPRRVLLVVLFAAGG